MNLNCPLCNSTATLFCEKPKHLFYKCTNCDGIFRPKDTFLTAEEEKEHYEKHNNDVFDETALEAIANASNGVPRIINKICDSSLMIGNTKNLNTINSDIIMLAVNEIELG